EPLFGIRSPRLSRERLNPPRDRTSRAPLTAGCLDVRQIGAPGEERGEELRFEPRDVGNGPKAVEFHGVALPVKEAPAALFKVVFQLPPPRRKGARLVERRHRAAPGRMGGALLIAA